MIMVKEWHTYLGGNQSSLIELKPYSTRGKQKHSRPLSASEVMKNGGGPYGIQFTKQHSPTSVFISNLIYGMLMNLFDIGFSS